MPGPMSMAINRRESGFDPSRSPMLHPALSGSLSKSFGLNSQFSLSALSSSLTALSSSPGFGSMSMSLGKSFEDRPKLEAQFFRNFSCCGLDLQDLHGLLEHFEECHVAYEGEENTDDDGLDAEMEMDDERSEGTLSGPSSPNHPASQQTLNGGSIHSRSRQSSSIPHNNLSVPDSPAPTEAHLEGGMELDMEIDDDHEDSNSSSANSAGGTNSHMPFSSPPMSAFDNPLPLHPHPGGNPSKKKFTQAMNAHGSSGFGILGIDPTAAAAESSRPSSPVNEEIVPTGVEGVYAVPASASTSAQPVDTVSLAPSLLFPVTPADSPEPELDEDGFPEGYCGEDEEDEIGYSTFTNVHSTQRGATRITLNLNNSRNQGEEGMTKDLMPLMAGMNLPMSSLPSALHPLGSGVQISPSGRPYTPPSEKPFKCSVPGCDKSYKQQNGLKYHRLHGHCKANAPGYMEDGRGEGKPYVCHVTSCGKRYKNMNGLRYHYQHSGAHGALGLQMLAQGCHPQPQFPAGHKRGIGQFGGYSFLMGDLPPLPADYHPSQDDEDEEDEYEYIDE